MPLAFAAGYCANPQPGMQYGMRLEADTYCHDNMLNDTRLEMALTMIPALVSRCDGGAYCSGWQIINGLPIGICCPLPGA